MNNFSTFIQAAAKFMAADRPDIYTEDEAHADLVDWYSHMSAHDREDSFGTGGYILSKRVDDEGDIYWMLSRSILELSVFVTEHDSDIFDWTRDSKVGAIAQLNIPEPVFDDDEFDDLLDADPDDLV